MNTNKKNNSRPQPKWLYIIPVVAVLMIAAAFAWKLLVPDGDIPADAGINEQTTVSTTAPTVTMATEPTTVHSTKAPTESPTAVKNPNISNIKDYTDGKWNMILVNPTHSIPDGFTVKTSEVQGGYKMDYRAAEYAKAMISAAKKDGINLLVCSGVRTHERQVEKYNGKVQEYINKGYSKEESEKKAGTIIAVPGTSEHESGLALDIVTPEYQNLNSGFENTEAFKWMYEHCKEYGFILRFPLDKSEITKIIYEPWHYRYVGTENSYKIMEGKQCLEEFLGQLD